MKTFYVTPKQQANIQKLAHYFMVLQKNRIRMDCGNVLRTEDPHTKSCCVATHMAICLNKQPSKKTFLTSTLTRDKTLYSHRVWKHSDNLLKEIGISSEKLQKISKCSDPYGYSVWGRSAKRVFEKLNEATQIR